MTDVWKNLFLHLVEAIKTECVQDKKHYNGIVRFFYKNGSVRPIREKGLVNGQKKALLGFGKDKPEFFAEVTSKQKNKSHEDHAKNMGYKNIRKWADAAADILNDNEQDYYLDWEIPADKTLNRFDKRTSRLAIGDKLEQSINTYFEIQKHNYKYYIPDVYLEELKKKK